MRIKFYIRNTFLTILKVYSFLYSMVPVEKSKTVQISHVLILPPFLTEIALDVVAYPTSIHTKFVQVFILSLVSYDYPD